MAMGPHLAGDGGRRSYPTADEQGASRRAGRDSECRVADGPLDVDAVASEVGPPPCWQADRSHGVPWPPLRGRTPSASEGVPQIAACRDRPEISRARRTIAAR